MEETVKSLKFDEHLQTELANESNAYPMNNIIQMVVRATGPNSSLPNDCKNQIETIRFARWIFYNSSAHEIVRGYHYFPLTSDTYDAISEHLSKTLKCGSSNESFVWTMMMAKIAAENETVNLGYGEIAGRVSLKSKKYLFGARQLLKVVSFQAGGTHQDGRRFVLFGLLILISDDTYVFFDKIFLRQDSAVKELPQAKTGCSITTFLQNNHYIHNSKIICMRHAFGISCWYLFCTG